MNFFRFLNTLLLGPEKMYKNNNLVILKSDLSFMVPNLLDGINTVATKLPFILEGIKNVIPELDAIKNLIPEVSPIVKASPNVVDGSKLLQWVESYYHVIRIKSIALEILSVQSDTSEFIPYSTYKIKELGIIINSLPISASSTLSCPLDNHWGIFISHNPILYFYKYIYLFVPLVVPFVSSTISLMFNLMGHFRASFLYLLSYLNIILGNCILYLINLFEFFFSIISILLHLGLRLFAIFVLLLKIIFYSLNSLIINSINTLNIYIKNKLNLFFINSKEYLPLYSIMYIYKNPQFIKSAYIYMLRNISIRSLFLGFINVIKAIYHISLFNFDRSYLIKKYTMYVDYIELCFESEKFLPLMEYHRYLAWLEFVDNHTDFLDELLREKRNLLNLLRSLVSENLYICGHRGRNDADNPVLLGIQVSVRARALLGLTQLEQYCLRLTAVHQELRELTEDQRRIYCQYHDAVDILRNINPNYDGGVIVNILAGFFNVEVARSQLVGFSHDMNEFFIIVVYQDGTLRYRYFF